MSRLYIAALLLAASAASAYPSRTVHDCHMLAYYNSHLAVLYGTYTDLHPMARQLRQVITQLEDKLKKRHPNKRIEDICPSSV